MADFLEEATESRVGTALLNHSARDCWPGSAPRQALKHSGSGNKKAKRGAPVKRNVPRDDVHSQRRLQAAGRIRESNDSQKECRVP
jgi:hypothetical protein